jgi:hypothetical protein
MTGEKISLTQAVQGQEELDFLTLEDVTDRLSRTLGKALPLDAA